MSEYNLHCAVAKYLDLVIRPPAWFTTFPAGGGGRARGGKLKAMGLKAGVPDILILHDGRPLWIELKFGKGSVSDVQILTHGDIVDAGGEVVVCRSVDQVEAALKEWGVMTKPMTANPNWRRLLKAVTICALLLLPTIASAALPAWNGTGIRAIGQGMTNVVSGTSTFSGGSNGGGGTGTTSTGGSTGTCSNCGDGGNHR